MAGVLKNGDIEAKLTKRIEEPDVLMKEVKIQSTGRQLIVQIPVAVADALDVEKGDTVIFKIPLAHKTDYQITIKRKAEK